MGDDWRELRALRVDDPRLLRAARVARRQLLRDADERGGWPLWLDAKIELHEAEMG